MSLASLLPAPKHAQIHNPYEGKSLGTLTTTNKPTVSIHLQPVTDNEPPPYGKRQNYQPAGIEDFGDGGAFPEIHILQYPLDMGRKDKAKGKVAPLMVDAEGNVKYDVIVRQGFRKGKNVFSNYTDLIESFPTEDELAKPDVVSAAKTAEKTRAALGLLVDQAVSAAQPSRAAKPVSKEPTFIRYTPSNQSDVHNSGAQQRIIRLQALPIDPLEPPKFKHRKLPNGPPSPPAPVMHSPPRKITVQDQQNWKIPPCISNWKNIKGYTIPLDKRLAADGRGLQEMQVNDKFAKLSETLFVAERNARDQIEARATLIKRIQQQQRQEYDNQLLDEARAARQAGSAKASLADRAADDYEEAQQETENDVEARQEREDLRKDQKRELRKEHRMSRQSDEKKLKARQAREQERDVSEAIALGKPVPKSKDAMFDQRLFNQNDGTAAGFGADDDYNVFDKPLFKGSSANTLYRPKASEQFDESEMAKLVEKSAKKFAPDRGFDGAERSAAATSARDKPVEFEREEAEDPYGLDSVLDDGKSKRGEERESKRPRREERRRSRSRSRSRS